MPSASAINAWPETSKTAHTNSTAWKLTMKRIPGFFNRNLVVLDTHASARMVMDSFVFEDREIPLLVNHLESFRIRICVPDEIISVESFLLNLSQD